MRKLYEIFKVLKVEKRIVSVENIHGNTVLGIVVFYICLNFMLLKLGNSEEFTKNFQKSPTFF